MQRQQSILNFFQKSSPQSDKVVPLIPTSQKKPFCKNNLNQSLNKIKNLKKLEKNEIKFSSLDLVWARLEGYPYWPAIICEHPGIKSIIKTYKNKVYYNVQFFDNPPQRSWIISDNCIIFKDEKHPTLNVIKDKNLQNSILWAKNSLIMNKEERSSLIAELQLSDEENESIEKISECEDFSPILNKSKKRKLESDDESDLNLDLKKKKINLIFENEDSEDDYIPDKNETSNSSSESDFVSDNISENEDSYQSENISDEEFCLKSKKFNNSSLKKKKFNLDNKYDSIKSESSITKEFVHLKFDFLKSENIKDKEGRRPDHPDYDPKTLFVPSDFLNIQTPAHKQWWKIKSENFDTVLFFKMGKFYELFHMDAVIICSEDNLVYMKGEYAHAGFPEPAFPRFANNLINKGYKVARIEQTETPEQRDKRCKNNTSSKADKVVMREMCRVTSKGTRLLGLFENEIKDTYSAYLMAITEKLNSENKMISGICFLDTTIGQIYLSQFIDDKYSSLLRTIFSHFPPVELLLEKDSITCQTLNIIKSCLPNVIITYLKSEQEFWSSRTTLKCLLDGPYFKKKVRDEINVENEEFILEIPESLRKLLDSSDPLNLTVYEKYDLAIRSFGACIYQLKRNLIEEDILTMKKIEYFDSSSIFSNNFKLNSNQDYMILDSVTIKNLELFENSLGTCEGSLLNTIDYCSTKFGKRTLRNWICKPLYNKQLINERLEAIQNLLELSIDDLSKDLKNLPDLERMFCKIHTQSLSNRSKNHPDSRAVMFEANSYNKKKINEFIQLIDSFRICENFVVNLNKNKDKITSKFLSGLITYEKDGGKFPYIQNILDFFDNAFDHRIAKEQGKIVPRKGVNKPFEKATENISNVLKELDNYLKEQIRYFGIKLKYIGNGKNRYQLEIPENLSKKVSADFELTSSRKGFKRYQTPIIKELLIKLKEYENKKEEAMQESMRLIFESFDCHMNSWNSVVKCISSIDCLISFAKYSTSLKATSSCCRPEFLDFDLNPKCLIKDAKHPCLVNFLDNFMGNDIDLDEKLMLLTGPNMGGKSTLMRQTGLIVILAHIGCFVPAKECKLTLVDKIFTRLGASDRILEGESTFYVELSETSSIIKHATNRSLVLIDELGRGTSTYDGTAIACSVVRQLAKNIKCLCMFSTHYHTLLEEFKHSKCVKFTHMACMIENENEQDPTKETITFLYKLVPNPCPKSYGFNAAKLADIPTNVIKNGFEQAKNFEFRIEINKLLSKLVQNILNEEEAKNLVKFLKF